jgi:hypothetical protein
LIGRQTVQLAWLCSMRARPLRLNASAVIHSFPQSLAWVQGTSQLPIPKRDRRGVAPSDGRIESEKSETFRTSGGEAAGSEYMTVLVKRCTKPADNVPPVGVADYQAIGRIAEDWKIAYNRGDALRVALP